MRAWAIFILMLIAFGGLPLCAFTMFNIPWPSPSGWYLGGIAVITVGIRFWVAEELAPKSWKLERTTLDLSIALAAAITSLAVLQQFEADKVLFPLSLSLVEPVIPQVIDSSYVPQARAITSGAALTSWAVAAAIFSLVWVTREGRHTYLKLLCAPLLAMTFATYYALILYKA